MNKEVEKASETAEMHAESATSANHNTENGPNFVPQDDKMFEKATESPAKDPK